MLFIIKYRRHPYANSMLMTFTHSATTDDSCYGSMQGIASLRAGGTTAGS